MNRLWRVFRRLIFFLITLYVSANAIAFLLLNNPVVHDWLRKQANHYLEPKGLEVAIGQISIDFLETKLNVSKIVLSDVGNDKYKFAEIGQFVLGFDPWRLNENWLPTLKFIKVEDWKLDLALMSKFAPDNQQRQKKETSVADILSLVEESVGRQIEFKNGQLSKRNPTGTSMDLRINQIFVKFNSGRFGQGLTLLADLGASTVCMSSDTTCTHRVTIDAGELNGEMSPDGTARLERIGFRGGLGDWQASGQVRFGNNFEIENYNLKIDGNSDSTSWFHLAGLQGRGRFKAAVFLNPEGDSKELGGMKNLAPNVHGQVSWTSIVLEGFDIYTGTADVQISDKKIAYKNAQISTPNGAQMEAHGEFSLEGEKPYVNTARIRQMPFSELMAGVRVPTNAVNFMMDTPELLVSGLMNLKNEKLYTLVISGLVGTTKMKVPNFEPNSVEMPDCQVQLRIQSDAKHMSFENSNANCVIPESERKTKIVLTKGLIDYQSSINDFRFYANALPASVISYFVTEEIEGSVDFKGSIYASPKTPVVFKADAQMSDVQVYGLSVPKLSGNIMIDDNGFSARAVEGIFDRNDVWSRVAAKNIYVGFSDRRIEIDANVDGELSDVLRIFGEKGREISEKTSGRLNVSHFRLRGNTKDLLKSNFDLKMRIRGLSNPVVSASDVQALFSCQQGWCSGSRAYFQNVALGQGASKLLGNSLLNQKGLLASKAIFEIDSVSEKSLSARLDIQAVPLLVRQDGRDFLSGVFDLRGVLQGGMKDWEVSANGRLDQLKVGGSPIGSIAVTASSHSGGPLNVLASGLFDQIQARVILDHGFEKSTQLFASFRSFELFKYIPFFSQTAAKISGEVTSDMSVDAPGLKTLLRGGDNTLRKMNGRGQIAKLRAQVGRENFSLTSPVQLNLTDGMISFSALKLRGASGTLQSDGQYSLLNDYLSARLESRLDAAILGQVTDLVSQSSGEILISGEVERADEVTSLRGEAKIENLSVAGKYISPPITALNGRMIFQDSRIEIPSLTGAKGNGQVDLVGTIDFSADNEKSQAGPALALRANLRSAQFRWPQEFFETLESTVDGQVEIVGTSRPYGINGDIRILKGRAYRDATCQEMIRSGASSPENSIAKPQKPTVRMNVGVEADNSFTLQSNCVRGRVSAAVRLTGTDLDPILSGQMRLDNGVLNLLKTRFDVTRADAVFDNIVKVEPRVDAQMVAKIEKYNVFVGAEGPLSKPRLNIWSDPSTGPDGNPLSRPMLIRMISTGRGPGETTQTAVTQAIANQVVGLFDDPLSQAVSKITRGFVDRFELQPILEAGQSSWRARASRDLGEKFNLGLDYEPNKQSLTGTIFINESVNVLGGFDRRSSQLGSYSELTGGFRFQFGGK